MAATSGEIRPRVYHVGRPNIGDKSEFMRLAGEMFDRHWLTNDGPLVTELEAEIAKYLNVRNCVAMCNGTIALEIAIRALGLKGEVIVPSFTFIATAHALYWQGITPVFADIDPETHNLDPESVRKMITPRTSGIIGVHLWGRAAPVEELQAIADEHGLQLMCDAAHAFGCTHKRKMIGGFGKAEVLSFHATKVFNTFEGGAVVTNDEKVAQKCRLMRNFGFAGYDNVIYPGTNGKMTEICAAMGLVNLKSLDEFIAVNKRNYNCYKKELEKIPGLKIIQYDEAETNNYHYIVVALTPEFPVSRDEVVDVLHKQNVKARKYFWPGCHKMMPYRQLPTQIEISLPATKLVSERIILLPTGTAVDEVSIKKITAVLSKLGTGPNGAHEIKN